MRNRLISPARDRLEVLLDQVDVPVFEETVDGSTTCQADRM